MLEPGRGGRLPQLDRVGMLSPRELIRNGVEIERLETIPLGSVLTEEALVDDFHADELGASMRQKRGQIIPIAVRPRIDGTSGSVVYDVIDGFHRTAGKKRSGDKSINAAVIYGCDDEEMMDLRILAASSVKAVQFPRLAQWMTKSFETTPWAKKGLTVARAFGIASNDRQTTRAGLDEEEVEEVKTWVREKSKRWGKTVASTHTILRIVENADPDIVKQVRNKGGGKDRSGQITPTLLAMVVENYPGAENFAAQRAVLRAIVDKRFYVNEARVFLMKADALFTPDMDEDQIYAAITSVEITPDDLSGEWEEHEVPGDGQDQTDQLQLEGVVVTQDELKKKKRKTTPRAPGGNYGIPVLRQLRAQVESLQADVARLSAGAEGVERIDTWWRDVDFLSDIERKCAERILYANVSIEATAQQLQLSPRIVTDSLVSALRKRSINLPQQKPSI